MKLQIEPLYKALATDEDRKDVFDYCFSKLYPGYELVKKKEPAKISAQEKTVNKRKKLPVVALGVYYDSMAQACKENDIGLSSPKYHADKWGCSTREALTRLIAEKKKGSPSKVSEIVPPVEMTVGGEKFQRLEELDRF